MSLKKVFWVGIILWLSWGWGQRKVLFSENNKLCLGAKSGLNFYMIEDGEIWRGETKLGETQRGCFNAPQGLCSIGKSTELVFKPDQLFRYFKKSVQFKLEGNKVWRKTRGDPQEGIYCFPGKENRYIRDYFNIKIDNFKELHRLYSAIPYVANVVIDDPKLLQVIEPFVKDCPAGDATCKVVESYQAVTKNLTYQTDPNLGGKDYIRTPFQTLKDKVGDCEDLTGVLVSFLANLKVNSYVLMTSDHAYAMACDVDPEVIKDLVRSKMNREMTKKENININYGESKILYYGLTGVKGKGKVKWNFKMESRYPMTFLVLPGQVTSTRIRRKDFSFIRECSGFNVTSIETSCELPPMVSVITTYGGDYPGVERGKNLGVNQAVINFRGNYNLADLNYISFHFYKREENGREIYCVVLEPTAGADGYPGFSRVKQQWSIAVNPVTWEWFYLRNRQSY